jgi:hypothetical protein
VFSLELGILAVECRRASNDLHDDSACLLRKPFGDRPRFLVDRTAKLHLHKLARAEGVVERAYERGRNAVRSNVHERIEVMSFGAKLGALLARDTHAILPAHTLPTR